MVIETKTDLKYAVLLNLPTGRANAIKGEHLAQRLEERDIRKIRLCIQELIEDGYPIIGSAKPPYGYYIADNPQDCQENLAQLMSYIKMLARHHKFLLHASYKKFSGQMKMKLGE